MEVNETWILDDWIVSRKCASRNDLIRLVPFPFTSIHYLNPRILFVISLFFNICIFIVGVRIRDVSVLILDRSYCCIVALYIVIRSIFSNTHIPL